MMGVEPGQLVTIFILVIVALWLATKFILSPVLAGIAALISLWQRWRASRRLLFANAWPDQDESTTTNERPAQASPVLKRETLPAAQIAPAVSPGVGGGVTASAVAMLPASARYQPPQGFAIPILCDGQRYHSLILAPDECTLVCGARRRGKGNLLQIIALSALAMGPERMQVWILDLKSGLDYQFCHLIGHAKLYSDGPNSDGSLKQGYKAVTIERLRREALIAAAGQRNIAEYNAMTAEPLPFLLLICDEVADLPSELAADLESVIRLSGAAGIIVYVATQRPTRDVVSGQIQSNTPNRIALGLASSKDTAVALSLGQGERAIYDPAQITEPGVAVLRRSGTDIVGRVPEMTMELRSRIIEAISQRWPRALSFDLDAEIARFLSPDVAEQPTRQDPPPPTPAAHWTADHVKVAAWIGAEPRISNREIARRLWPEKSSGGDNAVKAKSLREAVELLGVSPVSLLAEAANTPDTGMAEDTNS